MSRQEIANLEQVVTGLRQEDDAKESQAGQGWLQLEQQLRQAGAADPLEAGGNTLGSGLGNLRISQVF